MELIFNVIFYSLIGIYFLLLIILLIKKSKKLPLFNFIFIGLAVVYAVVRLILIPIKIKDYSALSEVGIYVSTAVITVILILLAIFLDRKKSYNTSRSIAYAGLSIATAYALSFIKIEFLGGSVTLASALPLIIYSYAFGTKKGVLAGVIFGVLQFVQKASVYHPMQVILDYPLAFGGIGLAGAFKNTNLKPIIKFILGAIVGLLFRYVSHVLSGYFVFGIYAGDYGFTSPLIYSIVYNMNVLIDLAIVLFIGSLLFSNKAIVSQIERARS